MARLGRAYAAKPIYGRRLAGLAGGPAVPTNSVAPYITYGGFVGRTQEIDEGTWSNTPTSYTYQWGRADNGSGLNAADITGETASTYTFQSADEGKYVYCDVTASNAFGASSETRSNYRFCYERVALPTPTELARTFDDLSGYDGEFIVNESISDSLGAVPDPVTWETDSPQGTIDWSWFTVAADVSDPSQVRSNWSGVVKLSENWGLAAEHVPGNGDAYYFLNTDGDTEIVVGSASSVTLGDTGATSFGVFDLRLIQFDGPVSDAEVPPVALPTQGLYNALAGKYALFLEMDRHLNRLLLSSGNSSSNRDTVWAATTADILETGDSGKPCFVLVDGTPVFVGSAYTTTGGPNPAHWIREIQDVLASTGDEVTLVDFEPLLAEAFGDGITVRLGLGM